MALINQTKTKEYPKTLLVHNSEGGGIWQIYHVQKLTEAENLAKNAASHGFEWVRLVEHEPETQETFPDWRETQTGIF